MPAAGAPATPQSALLVREHQLTPVPDWPLHVRELEPAQANGRAILFLHGIFADSRTFFSARDPQRAASWFAARGYRCFLADFRGHGRSPAPRGRWRWDFDDMARTDMPALLRFVQARHAGPLYVLAHSFGGCTVLTALALAPALQARLSGVAFIASAINDYSDGPWRKRLQFPLAAAMATLLGRLPARRLGLGSADEPAPLMRQFAAWSPRRRFCSRDGAVDYWAALQAVRLPVWACAGVDDHYFATPARVHRFFDHLGSVEREFTLFGRDAGLGEHWDHMDLVRGEPAMRCVMPRIAAWMDAHVNPAADAPRG